MNDKVPEFSHFLKNPLHVVSYVLLLYFVYKEFTQKDDCSTIIAKYEVVIKRQDARISKLENYVDVKNGVIKEIKTVLDTLELSKPVEP